MDYRGKLADEALRKHRDHLEELVNERTEDLARQRKRLMRRIEQSEFLANMIMRYEPLNERSN